MLVNLVLACNQLCLFFRSEKWIRHKIPVQLPISHSDLNQEESTALAHHRPQIGAVDAHLLHHEQSIRALGKHISPLHTAGLCRG